MKSKHKWLLSKNSTSLLDKMLCGTSLPPTRICKRCGRIQSQLKSRSWSPPIMGGCSPSKKQNLQITPQNASKLLKILIEDHYEDFEAHSPGRGDHVKTLLEEMGKDD